MRGNPILDRQIADSVQSFQQQQMPQQMPQQMAQMPQQPFRLPTQMPQMPRQEFSYQRPEVNNPIFGGAIPMNFGLPSVNQIPADYVARQFKPSMTNPAPAVKQSMFSNQGNQGNMNYLTGDSWNGGSQN